MVPRRLRTEKELLESLRNGDESSFTHFYDTYSKKIFLVAYHTTKSKETAKEIVQEVFAALWLNRKTITIKNTIEAYLIGAARHKVYDYFDKLVVRERYKNRVCKMGAPVTNTTEEAVDFNELNSLVNLQMAELSETTRQVFISSRFKGASIPEIARESSLSVKSVEYHLTKALKHLRARLASYEPGNSEAQILVILLLCDCMRINLI